MKSLTSLLTTVSLMVVAAALGYGLVILGSQWRADSARHACAQDYRMQYLDAATNTTIIKPIDDLYQQCLLEKGL